jgi:hypothetical protein
MVSRDVGLVSGLMLAACPGVFGLARYAILDTLFTMFTFGGAACLAVAALRNRPRLQWVGYLAIALGVQTKGPLALVLCGLTMLLLMALSGDLRRRLLALHWAVGLLVIAAVSAPWFVYMYVRCKDDFVNGYILDENVRLFAGTRFGNQPGFGFYFQILAAALLPWTGLLTGRLEHFPLVLGTRPWYFSRGGGADGRGVLDGFTNARAEGFGRRPVVEGAGRAVSRESRVGRCVETAAAGNGRDRRAETHQVSRPGVGGRGGRAIGGAGGRPARCDARRTPDGAAHVGGTDHDLARPEPAGFHG